MPLTWRSDPNATPGKALKYGWACFTTNVDFPSNGSTRCILYTKFTLPPANCVMVWLVNDVFLARYAWTPEIVVRSITRLAHIFCWCDSSVGDLCAFITAGSLSIYMGKDQQAARYEAGFSILTPRLGKRAVGLSNASGSISGSPIYGSGQVIVKDLSTLTSRCARSQQSIQDRIHHILNETDHAFVSVQHTSRSSRFRIELSVNQ